MFDSLNAYNFVFVALNLIILYVVLRKILFKPVTEFMEKRSNSIKDTIDDAEKLKAQALELKQTYENQMNEAKHDGENIIIEAKEKANRSSDEIILKAKEEAKYIIKNAREEIENERQQMIVEVQNKVAELVIDVASKLMDENMGTEKNKELIDKFLSEEGAA